MTAFLLVVVLSLTGCETDQAASQFGPTSTLLQNTITAPATATIIASATTIKTNVTPSAPVKSLAQVNSDWLRGTPCSLPCWEGIIPGQTTIEQAIEILKTFPFVQNITSATTGDDGELKWHWQGVDAGGIIEYHAQSKVKTIYAIFSGLLDYKLSDIIAAYGEPSHVSILSGPPNKEGEPVSYSYMFMYLSKGFYMNYQSQAKLILDTNFPVKYPSFFALDSLDSVAKLLSLGNTNVILPWQGFKSLDFYCRNTIFPDKPCP